MAGVVAIRGKQGVCKRYAGDTEKSRIEQGIS